MANPAKPNSRCGTYVRRDMRSGQLKTQEQNKTKTFSPKVPSKNPGTHYRYSEN